MFNLPYSTHRNLIEPITGARHVRIVLIKRFLNFLSQVKDSKKQLPKQMLNLIKRETRSTTGNNLRRILLLTEKNNVELLVSSDAMNIKYHPIK